MFVLIAVAIVAVLYTRLSGGGEPASGEGVATGAASRQGPADTPSDRVAEDAQAQEVPSSVRVGSARDQQVATVPDDGFAGLLEGSRPADAQPAGTATGARDAAPAGDAQQPGSPVNGQGADHEEEGGQGTEAATDAAAPPNALTVAGGVVTLTYPAELALATTGQPLPIASTIPRVTTASTTASTCPKAPSPGRTSAPRAWA